MSELRLRDLLSIAAVTLAACGGNGAEIDAGGAGDGAVGSDAGPMADARPSADAEDCEPPDMLIVLDRTMSMHRRPDGTVPADTPAGRMETKWYIAITAIEAVTASLDATIRFGLELFPRDPGQDVCVTLSERINGTTATNPTCEGGEVPVSPAISTGTMISTALDPEATRLCNSTPIGSALGTAQTHLAGIQDPVRDQFVMLLTDGQATCGEDPLSIANTQAMARAGVETYVIGFDASGTGVDPAQLNHLACAGRTAPGFPAPCTADGNGDYTATDPNTGTLFLTANDATALQQQLEQVAGQVCCNCIE